MKETYLSIINFLEDFPIYNNPNDVEIMTLPDDSVSVACFWPGEEDDNEISLEFFFTCETIEKFMHCFNIHSVEDINCITPSFLRNLFEQGQAGLSCTIDGVLDDFTINYYKKNGVLITSDDYNFKHVVPFHLTTAQEFRDYTKQHHLLFK